MMTMSGTAEAKDSPSSNPTLRSILRDLSRQRVLLDDGKKEWRPEGLLKSLDKAILDSRDYIADKRGVYKVQSGFYPTISVAWRIKAAQ